MPPSPSKPPPPANSPSLYRAAVEEILIPYLPDPKERSFVARCMIDEGPTHHRGASTALLVLLHKAVQQLPEQQRTESSAEKLPVRLRVPPHVRESLPPEEQFYPLELPLHALEKFFPDPTLRTHLADCLVNGPPHHALANVLMVHLLEDLLRRIGARE